MIYNILDNERVRGGILIVLLCSLLWFYPFFLDDFQSNFSFSVTKLDVFFNWFGTEYRLLSAFLSFVACLFISYIINTLLIKNLIVSQRTFIPAFIAMLTFSSLNHLNYFNSSHIIMLLLIVLIHIIFSTYRVPNVLSKLFVIGVITGLISTLDFGLTFILLAVLLSLISVKTLSLREFFVTLFGFLTPIYFVFSFLFIFSGDYMGFLNTLFENSFSLNIVSKGIEFSPVNTSIFFMAILAVISYTNILLFSPVNKIKQSKYGVLTSVLFICLLIMFAFYADIRIVSYIAIPSVIIVSIQTLNIKKKKHISAFLYVYLFTIVLSRAYPFIIQYV